MTEDIRRYVIRVIERRVDFRTSAVINFRSGEDDIDEEYMDNRAELEYIRSIISELVSSGEYVADSLIITASCSPEGTFRTNSRLAANRAGAISDYLYGTEFKLSIRHIPENWDRLKALIKADTSIKDMDGILKLFEEKSHDRRKQLLSSHPEYKHIQDRLYPILRDVKVGFFLHRKDMVKDTVHTTEPDTVYSSGIKALKDGEFGKAVRLLGSYRDINSALAFLAMDYNSSAMNILEDLPVSAKRDYLLAVSYSRIGNEKRAVELFLRAVTQDKAMWSRGNLDHEISRLIDKYNLTDKIQ